MDWENKPKQDDKHAPVEPIVNFTDQELAVLNRLRDDHKRRGGSDLFTQKEMDHLRFERWRVQTGRHTP